MKNIPIFKKYWKYTHLQYTHFFEKMGIFQNRNIPKKKNQCLEFNCLFKDSCRCPENGVAICKTASSAIDCALTEPLSGVFVTVFPNTVESILFSFKISFKCWFFCVKSRLEIVSSLLWTWSKPISLACASLIVFNSSSYLTRCSAWLFSFSSRQRFFFFYSFFLLILLVKKK